MLEYVDENLDGEVGLDALSGVAAYSKFHFQRQFAALFGMSAASYVQLRRLRRAAYQLAFREVPVGDIALESGYETPESFARAFRKACGQSPSEFRVAPRWDRFDAQFARLAAIRNEHMQVASGALRVAIVMFEETRVAALEHRGELAQLKDSLARFIAWRRQNQLPPRISATFNLLYDDHFDICAATSRPVAPNDAGIIEKVIPGGRCAVLRHVGSDEQLEPLLTWLYATWLPSSGEEPRDFPLFLQRVVFFPDVPEREAVTDVILPIV